MRTVNYRRECPEHNFKMSCYWTCPLGAKGCISHHGFVFVETQGGYFEVVSKTGRGQVASVVIRRVDQRRKNVHDPGVYILSPESLRTFSRAREQREYMARLFQKRSG